MASVVIDVVIYVLATEKMEFVLVNEQVAPLDARDVVLEANSGGDGDITDVSGFGEVDDAEV